MATNPGVPEAKLTLIQTFLLASVTLRLLEFDQADGPSAQDWDQARAYEAQLAEHGDDLLFRSKVPGRTATLANGLFHAIAVMAYVPGGISIFGHHWEAVPGRIIAAGTADPPRTAS